MKRTGLFEMPVVPHVFSVCNPGVARIAACLLLAFGLSIGAGVWADAPIGSAKGANPGRVVWAHDTNATRWKGLGDGHWWQDSHTSQGAVDRMLSYAVRTVAGKTDDASAWDTLFRYFNAANGRGAVGYHAGEKIAVKINLTFCNFFPEYCCVDSMTYYLYRKLDYMNTAPQVVRALLRQLVYVVGVGQADISVGDPVAYYANEYYDSCHAEFPDVQYIDHAGKFGRTKAEFSAAPVYWSCRPSPVRQDYVPRNYAEATYLISLANMKSHAGGGITACAKNHYGSLIRLPTDSGYYNLHQSLAFMTPQTGSYRALVDIMGHKHLGGKTVLYLVDGLYAGNHNQDTVPHRWSAAPFNGGWTSSLFASQDPVAIESVLFDIFRFDADPFQYPAMPGAQDYLNEAAQADNPPSGTFYDPDHPTPTTRLKSLGVFEHWDNAVDRKYSRNLGTGNGIELVFVENAANRISAEGRRTIVRNSWSLRALPASTAAEITVPEKCEAVLALYDARGRRAATVFDRQLSQGTYRVDLRAAAGGAGVCAPGFYVMTLFRKSGGKMERAAGCGAVITGR